MKQILVQAERFRPEQELESFRQGVPDCGAISSFIGYVRGESGRVSQLVLEHYPGFTEAEIETIVDDTLARFDISAAKVIHRYGAMDPGEPIVLVAAAAQHRKPAMAAVDCLMDYLKTDAPFWKKQSGEQGDEWIEPRGEDRTARQAWDNLNKGQDQ